jgi:hypothetical protein
VNPHLPSHPRKHSATTRALAPLLCLALLAASCTPTINQLARTERTATVRVESTPPGATVVVDDQPVGKTPTLAKLHYAVLEEEVISNDQRWGGLAGIVGGGLAIATGIFFFAFGAAVADDNSSLNDAEDLAAGVFYGYGAGFVAAGLAGIGLGLWAMLTANRKRTRVEPSALELSLQTPAAPGMQRLRIEGSGTPPPYDQLKLLRFDAASRSWLAPGKPRQLKLKMRATVGGGAYYAPRPVAPTKVAPVAPRPTPTPTKAPEEPGAPSSPSP